jgi:hypothetical protein
MRRVPTEGIPRSPVPATAPPAGWWGCKPPAVCHQHSTAPTGDTVSRTDRSQSNTPAVSQELFCPHPRSAGQPSANLSPLRDLTFNSMHLAPRPGHSSTDTNVSFISWQTALQIVRGYISSRGPRSPSRRPSSLVPCHRLTSPAIIHRLPLSAIVCLPSSTSQFTRPIRPCASPNRLVFPDTSHPSL